MIDNRRNPNDYMILDVDAYQDDTKHMSALQSGAVLLLLIEFYRRGDLPTDDERLAEIAKMTLPKWKAHKTIVMEVASNPIKYVQWGFEQ